MSNFLEAMQVTFFFHLMYASMEGYERMRKSRYHMQQLSVRIGVRCSPGEGEMESISSLIE